MCVCVCVCACACVCVCVCGCACVCVCVCVNTKLNRVGNLQKRLCVKMYILTLSVAMLSYFYIATVTIQF